MSMDLAFNSLERKVLALRTENARLTAELELDEARHFNRLTPAEAERLAILAEECGELIQAIGKVLRHGYESTHPNGGPTNREAVQREIGDVIGVLRLFYASGDVSSLETAVHADRKWMKMEPYLHHQRTTTEPATDG